MGSRQRRSHARWESRPPPCATPSSRRAPSFATRSGGVFRNTSCLPAARTSRAPEPEVEGGVRKRGKRVAMDPMSCELARDRLGARGGEFPPPAGKAFLAHLSNCASCRDEAVRIDPALLFALAAREAPQPDWTGFNSRLRVAIEQQDRETGLFGRLLDAGVLAPKRLA